MKCKCNNGRRHSFDSCCDSCQESFRTHSVRLSTPQKKMDHFLSRFSRDRESRQCLARPGLSKTNCPSVSGKWSCRWWWARRQTRWPGLCLTNYPTVSGPTGHPSISPVFLLGRVRPTEVRLVFAIDRFLCNLLRVWGGEKKDSSTHR